jgi:hypothetical protein
MGPCLGSQLQQPQMDHQIQPNTASRVFSSPLSLRKDCRDGFRMFKEDLKRDDFLTHTQEDCFLSLCWRTDHCAFPILNEANFKIHHGSLRVDFPALGTSRHLSPLVDIVLAICIQYGTADVTRNDGSQHSKSIVDGSDATIAGRDYYRRC